MDSICIGTDLRTSRPALLLAIALSAGLAACAAARATPASTPDGAYAILDPDPPQFWSCRRCADYRPTGGVWRLQLDRGALRLFYAVTEWASTASYSVEGDRMTIFNDGVCPDAVGEYTWERDQQGLALRQLEDPCAFGLRAENLTRQRWTSCEAASAAALPPECMEEPEQGEGAVAEGLPLTISVRQGDVRHGDDPPDFFVHANQHEIAPLPGVILAESPDSIGFGVTRVLWGEGQWLEASTELPIRSFGIQFLGEHVIGWARVLFDGTEIWRGDTAQIWSKGTVYGGYIEVSGLEPGPHTLRVESLGINGRAVMVSFFGFERAR